MTTQLLAREARRHVALYSSGDWTTQRPKMSRMGKKVNGKDVSVLVLKDVPVFRSGVFRDSMGFQHTWEPLHMDQMVSHFNLLRNRQIFADVPVRDGHPGWLISGTPGTGKNVGWHTELRTEERTNPTDGVDYTYLLADYEVLDADAIAAIESGLWRNRSSEVGSYTTNAEAEFWPVYQGFAYVDIPAVEGLNGFSKSLAGIGSEYSILSENEKEAPVSGDNTGGTGGAPAAPSAEPQNQPGAAPEGASGSPDTNPDANTTDSGGAGGATQDEGAASSQGSTPTPAATVQPPSSGGAPAEGQHGGITPAQRSGWTFTLNGAQTNDFNAVQAHITSLEQFRSETHENARKSFVKSLAEGPKPKVLASKLTELEEFALGLSPGQYAQWVTSWDAVEPSAMLNQHHGGEAHQGAEKDMKDDLDYQIEIAEGTVKMHKDGGMKPEALEKTASYKKLQLLLAERDQRTQTGS
jgi:hypothetical protein